MSDHEPTSITRRHLLKTGALLAAAPLLGSTRPAAAQAPAKSTKVLDFHTGADVAKAEQEGNNTDPDITHRCSPRRRRLSSLLQSTSD